MRTAALNSKHCNDRCGLANPARASVLQIVLLLALMICAAASAYAEPTYPELTGRIVDQAGLLTSADRAEIEVQLSGLESTSTDQFAVVTVNSLEGYAIEDYAIGLARTWQLGQKDKDNGVLLLVAPTERKVRIEVGRRLEPLLTDTMSKLVIENAILPRFRRGDFSGGIKAGVTDIKDLLLGDAEAVLKRAQGRRDRNDLTAEEMIMLALWIAILTYIVYQQYRHFKGLDQNARPRRRRRLDDGSVVIIPAGHPDHWDGGWSGGGGGWSGGGGGFGGGGASGSW